ncbi:MAG: GreA/GreB family elongation factor [Phaeodactylibacter sp.]|nr:GreA/GreB family elongation factor [Phaeodactylibacter sp.]
MPDYKQIKTQLHAHCLARAAQSIQTARAALEAAQEAGNSETKSSAGDKYETGRAMMQAEQERYKAQLLKAIELKNRLAQIRPDHTSETAGPGSLVITNHGNFYLSAGLGKARLGKDVYFAISPESPLGQALKGRRAGEEFMFQNKSYNVEVVA